MRVCSACLLRDDATVVGGSFRVATGWQFQASGGVGYGNRHCTRAQQQGTAGHGHGRVQQARQGKELKAPICEACPATLVRDQAGVDFMAEMGYSQLIYFD